MSGLGQANITPDLPRVWACNWDWCPETFRRGSDLSRHLNAVHFKKIVKVRKRDLSTYLRSVRGDSGVTDSLLAAFLPTTPTPTPTPTNHKEAEPDSSRTDAATSIASQRPPVNTTSHEPPIRLGQLACPEQAFEQVASIRCFLYDFRQTLRQTKADILCNMRRAVFPNVYTVGCIHAAIPCPLQHDYRRNQCCGTYQFWQPQLDISTETAIECVCHERLGASPTPDRPRIEQVKVPDSSSPMHTIVVTRPSHIRSPDSNSVVSAQAVEDALTQDISAAASPQSRVGSLQYPSQSDSSGRSVESQQFQQRQHQSSPSQAASYYGSHAVESTPRFQPHPASQQLQASTQLSNAARPVQSSEDGAVQSQAPSSQASTSARVIPPLPRTRRAKVNNSDAAPEMPTLPRRTLRSRSKTPAPPPVSSTAVEPPRPPLPRRTTRSRTPSAPSASAATTSEGGTEVQNAKPKRASSKQPATEGRKARAGSGSRSKPPSTGAKKATTSGKPGGLPAVQEQLAEPDSKPLAILVEDPVPTFSFSQAPVADGPPQSQTGFRSGVIHIPLPRRTRARSASQQQQSQPPPIPQSTRIVEKEVKRELLEDVMDTDTQRHVPASPESSQPGGWDASQGPSQSQGGYEEGFGFDMGSLVLQTQAPYKWSQSQ
ncbi:hypothetical protein ONZ51_g2512 [Trametes cubensis]|uniref:C2H2-type domain-containing protein n=1 Tax=Trametes cubensis TaxID=1111947 RepID=A0AAD7XDW2_9APHY|nr:hypothetical protein ONZ51_g2512 [Trametes cubensis]